MAMSFFGGVLGPNCSMWDLVPWPGEPRPPALGAWTLNHWITRESLHFQFFENKPFSIVAAPVYLPPIVQEGSLFSTSSLPFVICRLFNEGHSDWSDAIPHCFVQF